MRTLKFLLIAVWVPVSIIYVDALKPKELFALQRSAIRPTDGDWSTPHIAEAIQSALGTVDENVKLSEVFAELLYAIKSRGLSAADAQHFVKLMVDLSEDSSSCNTFWAYLTIYDIMLGVYGDHKEKYFQGALYVGDCVLSDLERGLSTYADLIKDHFPNDKTVKEFIDNLNREFLQPMTPYLAELILSDHYMKKTHKTIASKIVSILDRRVPKEARNLFPASYNVVHPAYKSVTARLAEKI